MDYQEFVKIGIGYKNQEQFSQAVELFSEAITMDATKPEVFFYRANIYNHSLKRYSEALLDYDWAIGLNDQDEFYYYNRALCHLNLGDVDGALADYDHALALNPDYALAI